MSRPLFLSAAATAASAGDRLVLDGDEGRHAATVMRVRAGEEIDVGDGAGVVVTCRVVEAGRGELSAEVVDRAVVPPARPHVTVVQAIPKGDRGELAVEMLTELDVDRIVPWAAERSVAVWRGERAAKSLAKWRATARTAAKQARRARLPEVTEPASTAEVAVLLAEADAGLVLHEEADRPLAGVPLAGVASVVVVVGPEGGLSDAELDALGRERAVLLGTSVLRTSTAGVAAVAALLSRTSRWGGSE